MLTCALGLAACVSGSDRGSELSKVGADDVSDDVGGGGDDEHEVCEVESGAIGVVGEVPTHGTTLEVRAWFPKQGQRGSYIGFELSRLARFTVLAGGREYQAEGTSWTHPQGDAGAAITGIDFCDDFCEDEGEAGGDEGGGGLPDAD
jgi:hypothetical protein